MLAMKNAKGESLGEQLQFVTFDLSVAGRSLSMALNVQKIKEVVECESLSPVPAGCEYLLGIYDLRGNPVPVLDIQRLISKASPGEATLSGTRLIICDLQNIWIAIPVAKTGRIVTCPSHDFLPPPPGGRIENTNIITGLIRRGKGYVPVLDLDTLLQSIGYTADSEPALELVGAKYSGKRVLIVDDSRVILKKLTQLFTKLGFEAVTASNGRDAFKLLEEREFRFDLVFTDIEMPVLDGIAFAREVKSHPKGKNIALLFNSALSNPALIADIEKENLGRYLVKFDQALICKHLDTLFS